MNLRFSISAGLTTRANAWGRRRIDQQIARVGDLCMVEQIGAFRNYKIISSSKPPPPPSEVKATTLWEVLEEWGNTWLWQNVKSVGNDSWLGKGKAICDVDGSFMSKRFPNMNSCTFILECTRGRGRKVGHYPEHSMAACTELLGLLALPHLILLAANTVDPASNNKARPLTVRLLALDHIN